MELGATVCIPRSPQCLICPVREHCEAFAAGVQEKIPSPRKARPTSLLRRAIVCIRRGNEWLIEQRPLKGRWAGMWQFVTLPVEGSPDPKALRAILPIATAVPQQIGVVTHGLTHRRYHFDVFTCKAEVTGSKQPLAPRVWTELTGLSEYPLPRPHLKVLDMLQT
jgi:A/G-specific adenine glycosylase